MSFPEIAHIFTEGPPDNPGECFVVTNVDLHKREGSFKMFPSLEEAERFITNGRGG